jgi:ribosomal protein S18 acetylase RimI-like enzyme
VAFFVLRVDGRAAGCGGIMLVGQEYGELLIEHLAAHAKSNGITLLRLETGIHQQAAIRLYEQCGFRRIPPFAPYFEDPVSRCYEMSLA